MHTCMNEPRMDGMGACVHWDENLYGFRVFDRNHVCIFKFSGAHMFICSDAHICGVAK